MHKLLFLIFFFSCLSIQMFCQPEPCPSENPEMTPTCLEACVICDIDGFSGRHDSNVSGMAPSDFCTVVVHNAQWIAFIAGSTELTVNIAVSNCIQGPGLEMGIYEAIDCESYNSVSNCIGGFDATAEGQSSDIITNEPLTIGQYYYIVMDGAFGDNCDWTLSVTNGNTQVPPLADSGPIDGDLIVCAGTTSDFFTEEIIGASDYLWTLDGVEIPSDALNVSIDWTEGGTYTLGVQALNACDEANPTFVDVVVLDIIEPQILTEIICEGEEYILNDTISITEAGEYEFNFLSEAGCDSTIFLNLTIIETSIVEFEFDICEGDTIFIGENPFFLAGDYTEVLPNYLGCDSIVNLNLGTIVCLINGESTETPVVCNGESSGQIDFILTSGIAPLSYEYQNLEGTITGNGAVTGLNESQTISNLPSGTYLITVNDEMDNSVILIQELSEAPVLDADFILSNYNGVELACFGDSNGTAEIIPTGGVLPYSILWNTGATNSEIIDLSSGNYSVSIIDDYGCEIVRTTQLNEPDVLTLLAEVENASCEGIESGLIRVLATDGGTNPYLYDFGIGFMDTLELGNVGPGTYTVTVQDANGCEADTSFFITAPIIPEIELGDNVEIFLGDEIELEVISNIDLDSTNATWSPALGLSCTNCESPVAMPFNTAQYFLSATSINDCTRMDSIEVVVIPRRRVFVPNAFSPDFDGVNDVLNVFGGKEVELITEFTVYSRWGELIYQNKNFTPNNLSIGWEGEFRGRKADVGTYVWIVQATFLDGETAQYTGDVLLIR